MERRILRLQSLVACVIASGGAAASAAPPPQANDNLTEILVLSNRADLVSGGNALVEIRLPAKVKARPQDVKVDVDGVDVTGAFAMRADGRFYGLVSGLAEGVNRLRAKVPNGPGAVIEITNHPIGGPVISGDQVGPWVCTTKVAAPSANNPDLGEPLDAKCNIAAPVYRYQYRTLAGTFATYNPASPPAATAIATTTTDTGATVPYIVRIERGVINRGKYDIAYLANPADPTAGWQPWNVSPSWNRKVFWRFGSGCEYGLTQGNPGGVVDHNALSKGFMVASSEMTNYGTHCNDVTSAETVMMIKEHIAENYGAIRYTLSDGSSGGAHQQHLHSTNYPGLLQGILPSDGWQDTWTTGREFADCGLLKRYYDGGLSGLAYTNMDRAHIAGHVWNQVCEGPANTNMASRTPFYMDPTVGGQGCGTHPDRWSLTNLDGIRCTLQDFNIAVFGPRDATGYAKTPQDNVGIQYGFRALNAGRITVEQFVKMNEMIGGYDINGQWQAARMQADPGAVEIAHGSGRVAHGKGIGEVAVIADVVFNVNEEHYDFRNYSIRNRVLEAWGDHDTHVIWRRKGNPPDYAARRFNTMDAWLAAVEADTSDRPLRAKLAANKPALAVDACWRSGVNPNAGPDGWSTNPAYCNTGADPHSNAAVGVYPGSGPFGGQPLYVPTADEWPVYRDTRVAAGEGDASDIMKCQLKPLAAADYAVSFTAEQWARLQAALPNGVCNYAVPGIAQAAPAQWQTFANDTYGGRPLGAAPVSKPGDGGN
jgi:hypothetical protein